jgi:hypothetical protein
VLVVAVIAISMAGCDMLRERAKAMARKEVQRLAATRAVQ